MHGVVRKGANTAAAAETSGTSCYGPSVRLWICWAGKTPRIHPIQFHLLMRNALPTILLVVGLAIVGYGLVQKDEKQASIELGDAEIQLGKKDSFFSPYFIIGGIAAIAGLVMLVSARKS